MADCARSFKSYTYFRNDKIRFRPQIIGTIFLYNNVVQKIQTIFITNRIKTNNFNKTWDYTNSTLITTRGFLELNTK